MTIFRSDRVAAFVAEVRKRMSSPAHSATARAAEDSGKAIQSLLSGGEEGKKRGLQLALSSTTSLICEHNGYQLVVANPERAAVGLIGPGGLWVSDGDNTIAFDTTSGQVATDGTVHQHTPFYWDLGEPDGKDAVFVLPLED